MAILGTLIDKQTISVAGSTSDSVVLKTFSHSLPATNPEMMIPNLRSIAAQGGNGANGLPMVFAVGGNASIATVGHLNASSPSVPLVLYDLYCIVWHSIHR